MNFVNKNGVNESTQSIIIIIIILLNFGGETLMEDSKKIHI